MRTLTARYDRILDDLRTSLEDGDDTEDWQDVVEDAMNEAWDQLIKLGDPR